MYIIFKLPLTSWGSFKYHQNLQSDTFKLSIRENKETALDSAKHSFPILDKLKKKMAHSQFLYSIHWNRKRGPPFHLCKVHWISLFIYFSCWWDMLHFVLSYSITQISLTGQIKKKKICLTGSLLVYWIKLWYIRTLTLWRLLWGWRTRTDDDLRPRLVFNSFVHVFQHSLCRLSRHTDPSIRGRKYS